ncbi:MAG: SAM-dependent methyltransferase [Desulfobulbaceae bacterium]|nr:SAM-dependent methyltransferase [Desulfobulbaceae bacterium]
MAKTTRNFSFFLTAACLLLITGVATASDRSDEDQARDVHRKPAEVLDFLGLQSGDTVVDIWAAGGWYTEVLSNAVGDDGHVYSQNPPSVLQFRDGVHDRTLTARLADGRLGNVERIDVALEESSIAKNSIDFAITALNFHDVYNRNGADAAEAFMASVYAVLRPNGVFAVIDHVGNADVDNSDVHRMDPALAKAVAISAGFVVEAEGDVLSHPEDDHSKKVFDPAIRGETDRFILKLRKPDAE